MTGKWTFVGFVVLATLVGWLGAVAVLQSERDARAAEDGLGTGNGLHQPVLNVRDFGARGDGETDDTEAIQAAWDAARTSGARVVLPPGEYLISLQGNAEEGYEPALRLSPGPNKERQPIMEGASRAVTLKVDFPPDADRLQEVIYFDREPLTDNQRGLGLRNFRLVNANEDSSGTWQDPIDYHGVGIRIDSGWTGELLHNFQIRGFHVGLMAHNFYSSSIGVAEIRNCNFGIALVGTPNANRFHDIMLRGIRPVESLDEDDRFTRRLTPDVFPGGRIGAGLYIGGGTISGALFESVNTEQCSVAGYFLHQTPISMTVTSMRSEATYAPIWVQGPISPWYSDSITFISPSIQGTSLIGPAVYLNRARGYTFISPRFYRMESEESRTAIKMTTASLGNYILNPVIMDPDPETPGAAAPADGSLFDDGTETPGAAAAADAYIIDEGTNNEVKLLVVEEPDAP